MLPKPYFMKNEEWYYFDEEEHIIRLTEKATRKAKRSYKEFYEELDDLREDKATKFDLRFWKNWNI